MCTTTMDSIAKYVYSNPNLLYYFKGTVPLPPICMIDDLASIQKCQDGPLTNAVANSMIELNKLTFSKSKCSRIHIGMGGTSCPELKVHDSSMVAKTQNKYLGDIIHESSKIKFTIKDRISKGHGIISDIISILKEIPLGHYKTSIGIRLRQALFLNGILYSSESWHGVHKEEVNSLMKLDAILLRAILGCHSKTPIEFMFLETGTISLNFILAQRRLC